MSQCWFDIGNQRVIVAHLGNGASICEHLQWLGIILDEQANNHHATIISKKDESAMLVGVIPTNEDYMIAKHTADTLNK